VICPKSTVEAEMSISGNSRRMLKTSVAVLSALAATFGVQGPAEAATIKVTTKTDELNNQPPCSLREAIRSANADVAIGGCQGGEGADRITLPAGVYKLTLPNPTPAGENGSQAGDLDVLGSVTIAGTTAGKVIVDGNGAVLADRVFDVAAGVSAVFEGITIRNGSVPTGAAAGGGVSNDGSVTFRNTTISGNSVGASGAGVRNSAGTSATFINSTVSGNAAGVSGGGVSNVAGASVVFVNSTISGNRANTSGGGIFGGAVTLSNATVTANVADADVNALGSGGGVGGTTTVVTSKNTIIAGNVDASPGPGATPDCDAALTSQGYNLIGTSTGCTITLGPGDKVGPPDAPIDPALGALRDNGGPTFTHAVLGFSPARNTGSPAAPGGSGDACTGSDQRGAPRSLGGRCDIGSNEYVTCMKAVVNRVGTPGKDVLTGTKGRDGLLGLGGNDRLKGRGGGDRACGGKGKDTLIGGPGADRLSGEAGSDLLSGGDGSDRCIGGPGRDRAISCEREDGIP
jgi:CSLREA domain-containing protein